MKKTPLYLKRVFALLMAAVMLTGLGISAGAKDYDVQFNLTSANFNGQTGAAVVGYAAGTWGTSGVTGEPVFTPDTSKFESEIIIPETAELVGDISGHEYTVIGIEAGTGISDSTHSRFSDTSSTRTQWIAELHLPKTILYIGDNALAGCKSATIYYDGTCKQWSKIKIGSGSIPATCKIVCTSAGKEDHVLEKVQSKSIEPTCLTDGEYLFRCNVCGEEFTETIPASAEYHNFQKESTVAPTCKADGYDLYRCTYCQQTEQRNVITASEDFHNYVAKETGNIEATCTEAGRAVFTCTHCGQDKEIALAALGHDWTHWESNNDRTFFRNGTETRTCERCDLKETQEIEHTNLLYVIGAWIAGACGFLARGAFEPIRLIIDLFYNIEL